ncbi:MAG: DNA-directed RNA polymerase subunit alpha [Candidatus Woykebacteria bacterium RIFCSPHIGHO2_01_FULL_39_12]|uniref:DNA-directed RNA polymerase subunit alpha n=2 Tax=Candidatus Woykeibacteriota TaxID=1817899 RepID=A0A1G1WDK8_9BACT|nr:MAG: DNA-directed RNA polymerase subunit alpha [Candidatus Woykebacteria bacterium RBG_16_39_9b]OGY27905.1 MAG: DNA-directed RNA polymerase subunit alpha [Candidatus Woykebacteria bacterium RIFCSPHIGHO2_01_FULL_39_12]
MLEEIKISQKGNNHESVIVVEPLPQGYGMTLGNALRRVLLSSLPGSAITQVKIPGVPHEYSTIKGVKEDVVEILLNLKKVRLKIEGDKPVKLSLEATGPKEAKAADIKTPPNVKVSNPDLIIAHLADSKTKLNIDLTAEKGVGYAPVENRKSLGIGVIPLGATFSPVLKVNYRIESTRVGQMTNFDKLTLEIMTDGTITPAETIKEAAKILADYFNVLVEQKQPRKEKKEVVRKPKVEKDASIEELELSTRITNALRSAGIETVGQLLSSPKDQLSKLKNMGAKSISDIEEKIKEKGLV